MSCHHNLFWLCKTHFAQCNMIHKLSTFCIWHDIVMLSSTLLKWSITDMAFYLLSFQRKLHQRQHFMEHTTWAMTCQAMETPSSAVKMKSPCTSRPDNRMVCFFTQASKLILNSFLKSVAGQIQIPMCKSSIEYNFSTNGTWIWIVFTDIQCIFIWIGKL